MINKKISELLNEYKSNNPDMSLSDMSNAKHLIMRQLLDRKYFEGMQVDLYINDMENVVFYNGVSSVDTIPKEEFGNTGGYVLTQNQVERLEEIQDILSESQSLNDLVGKFDEDDALLIQKFSVAFPRDEFFSLICMAKFRESLNKDPNYQISYDEHYAKSMLLVGVEQGCSLDQDFKYSFGPDNLIKRHLTNNINVINQETMSTSTLKGMIRAENKTLAAICDKKLIANPDIATSDHKTIYGDLSDIYNNPLIKENTMFGIIFDDQLSGPEKLMKIYEKRYFNKVKDNCINTIDFQLNKPTIEELSERYAKIVDPIVDKLDSAFPILNTARTDNIYYTKSDFDFDNFFATTKNKDMIISRDLFSAEKMLINATMDGYFSRTLIPENYKLLEKQISDTLKMTATHIENYHNNIESILLLKTRIFSARDLPTSEKPNIILLDHLHFPNDLSDKSFDILRDYIQEKQKEGVTIIINAHYSHYNSRIKEELLKLDEYSNVVVSVMDSFEVKFNKILESLDSYDKNVKLLSSSEKTHLVISGIDKMNIELQDTISPYSSSSANKAKEFMDNVIKYEVANGFKHKTITLQNKKDAQWGII
jgi:hypothetical protein